MSSGRMSEEAEEPKKLRTRKDISQADIEALNQHRLEIAKTKSVRAREQQLKALLIETLSSLEETDWDSKVDTTEDAKFKDALEDVRAAAVHTLDEQHFMEMWEGGDTATDFPYAWKEFVKNFREEMLASQDVSAGKVYRVVDNYKTRKPEGEEVEFWNENNLCRLFIHYLFSLHPDTNFTDEIKRIQQGVIAKLTGLDEKELQNQFQALSIEFQHFIRARSIQRLDNYIVEEIYNDWRAYWESDRDGRFVQTEWMRRMDSHGDGKIFKSYVELLTNVHAEWQQAVLLLQPKEGRDSLTYVASGAGIGLLAGIIAGAITIATCGLALPILLGVVGTVLLLAAIGGTIAYKVKTYLDERDIQKELHEEATPSAETSSPSFTQRCSTAFALLSVAGCCMGAPTMPTEDQQTSSNAPITQVDDDGYDADDSDAESESFSKRPGLSS